MTSPVIILVGPQLGENIGAVARAMKNFSCLELRIVKPRDGWPNPKAESAAVGAIDLIHNAKIYEDLPAAIADIEYLYATTAQSRDMNKEVVMAKNLVAEFPYQQKVGIMFGRENCGLTNEEIMYANKIIAIDTNPEFTSLNIAQAVLVICYELFKAPKRPELENRQELASKEEINYFYEHLLNLLDERDFFKVLEKKPLMQRNIINIFSRIEKINKTEVQTLRGILSCLSSRSKKD